MCPTLSFYFEIDVESTIYSLNEPASCFEAYIVFSRCLACSEFVFCFVNYIRQKLIFVSTLEGLEFSQNLPDEKTSILYSQYLHLPRFTDITIMYTQRHKVMASRYECFGVKSHNFTVLS